MCIQITHLLTLAYFITNINFGLWRKLRRANTVGILLDQNTQSQKRRNTKFEALLELLVACGENAMPYRMVPLIAAYYWENGNPTHVVPARQTVNADYYF